jgi:four helix bundle protein
MNNGYRDLEVYRLAHDLGVALHEFSLKMPKYELFETGSQLRRASKSISANIVEGYGRKRYKAEFSKFLVYALASCDETMEWIRYVKDCHPDCIDQAEDLLRMIDELGRKLNRFMQSVEANHAGGKRQASINQDRVSSDK